MNNPSAHWSKNLQTIIDALTIHQQIILIYITRLLSDNVRPGVVCHACWNSVTRVICSVNAYKVYSMGGNTVCSRNRGTFLIWRLLLRHKMLFLSLHSAFLGLMEEEREGQESETGTRKTKLAAHFKRSEIANKKTGAIPELAGIILILFPFRPPQISCVH